MINHNHTIIKFKSFNVKFCTYIDFGLENVNKDPKFKVGEYENQAEFRVEKVIKRKGDKLYVKCKGYHNSFNSWIEKKDIA